MVEVLRRSRSETVSGADRSIQSLVLRGQLRMAGEVKIAVDVKVRMKEWWKRMMMGEWKCVEWNC